MEPERSRFRGKVVLIIGGAVGIGKKITESFAQEGATTIFFDIDSLKGEELLKNLKKNNFPVNFFSVNITDEENIKEAIAAIIQEHKRIDIIINNVRGPRERGKGPFESSLTDWITSFNFILGGAYLALKYTLPEMAKQKKGVVLNMGSVSGLLIGDESLQYHVAKAGLIQLTKFVADRYGKDGIRANCISPGFIVREEDFSQFNQENNQRYKQTAILTHPLRKIGSTVDVARAALFLCSEESSFITGENLVVDGGLTIRDQWSVASQISKADEDEKAKHEKTG